VAFAPVIDMAALLKSGRTSSGTAVSLKDYCILPSIPSADEWKRLAAVYVKVYRNRSIKSVKELQAPIAIGMLRFLGFRDDPSRRADKTRESTMFMRRAADPFAEGEIRIAYHAQLNRKKHDLGDANKSAMVMKAFKHIGKGPNDRDQYLKQMEVSNIAKFLADEYNKSSLCPAHCAHIRVLQVCVVEEEDETNEKAGARRFCAEEPLPTDGSVFIKFSNNTGHWEEDHLDESLLRFADFTYQITNKYLMVTDLQGDNKGNQFHLTDPVILCKDILRFGNTNLGEKFMEKCIDSTRELMKENG